METLLSLLVGLGLSAACGFRVFVPLLLASIAANTGHLALAPSFAWIGTSPALIAFAIATALEIAGYYIPWVDHFLDTVSSPASVVAGAILTASVMTDLSPFLKWTLAVTAGGGLAGLVKGSTVLARGFSLATTGGLANPLVASAELAGAIFTSLLALILPVVGAMLLLTLLLLAGVRFLRRKSQPAVSLPSVNCG